MLKRQAAFTLIELSIVLVIIGLLVGGVLVGRDLIRAAEMRATISQIEKYQAAVNTFVVKYNGLPGDLIKTSAQTFGLFAEAYYSGIGTGAGDGNGSISTDNNTGLPCLRQETLIFWRHLGQTKLIEGSYSASVGTQLGQINAGAYIAVQPTDANMMGGYIPSAKIGRSASFTVGSYNNGEIGAPGGTNYYVIAGINGLSNSSSGAYTYNGWFSGSTDILTPSEAYRMDAKMDDGNPLTGGVTAISAVGTYFPLPGTSMPPISACASSSAYVIGTLTPSCSLQIKFR